MNEFDCSWMKIFDAPVGGNELSPDAVYQGETVYLDISDMPAGYVFVGWTDLQGQTIETTKVGDRYKVAISCGNGFKVYMRTQTENECLVTVSWTPQQVQGLSADIIGDPDSCNSTVDILAKSDNCCYEFEAWSDSDPDNQNPNRTVPVVTGSNSYTALFKKKKFQVTADVNNSNYGNASASADYIECGDPITLTATPNEGYVFDRWEPDGNTNTELAIDAFNCEDYRDAYFKAIFSPKTKCSLTYDENYPGAPAPYSGGEYEVGDTVTLITVSRAGYEFLGWCHDQNMGTCAPINGQYLWPSLWCPEKTLYAKWRQLGPLYIHYYGSQNNPADYQTSLWNDAQTESASFNLRTLNDTSTHRFLGWKILTNSEQTSDQYTPTNPTYSNFPICTATYTMPNEDLYAFAIWEEKDIVSFTLTYVANNGTQQTSTEGGIQQGTTVTVKSPSNPNLSFSYPNHTFREWLDQSTTTVYPAGGQISSFPMTNVSLEAQWDEDPLLTIDYNINQGAGQTPASQSGYYNSNITLADNSGTDAFYRQGYTFLGWSTNPSASQASYTASQTISLTQSMTLYAVWQEEPKFRVRYDCGNGTVVNDPIEYENGDIVTVGLCDQCVIPDGCTCTGWCTTNNCSGSDAIIYQAGDTFAITENTTLYLQLECCNITFDVFCGGCTNTTEVSILYRTNSLSSWDTLTLHTPTPVGYNWEFDVQINRNPYCYFTGWFDVESLSYVFPDTGNCQWEWEYKLIPPLYAAAILSGTNPSVHQLTDSAYREEVKYKQDASVYGQGAFIYNTATNEMRQLVKRCKDDSEAYDFTDLCNHTLIAIVECCSVQFTFDIQNAATVEINGHSYSSDTSSEISINPINVPVRVGQNFEITYDDTQYYVTDVVDKDTGESIGLCECCYDSFPALSCEKNVGCYIYYYLPVSTPMSSLQQQYITVYDIKYVLDSNSPQKIRIRRNGQWTYAELQQVPACSNVNPNTGQTVWNEIYNNAVPFYRPNSSTIWNDDYTIPDPETACNESSVDIIVHKTMQAHLIKAKVGCQYAVDCGHRYHICIANREYTRPREMWQQISQIPTQDPSLIFTGTIVYESMACFEEAYQTQGNGQPYAEIDITIGGGIPGSSSYQHILLQKIANCS